MLAPWVRRRERTIEKDAKHPCPLPEAGPWREVAVPGTLIASRNGGTLGMDRPEIAAPEAILAVVFAGQGSDHVVRPVSPRSVERA